MIVIDKLMVMVVQAGRRGSPFEVRNEELSDEAPLLVSTILMVDKSMVVFQCISSEWQEIPKTNTGR
jgi:hypothetical protein